jgi:thioesterase DpgC
MTAADLPKLPKAADRTAREQYLRAHAAALYEHLTDGRRLFLRADELCRRAAESFPGLVPSQEELADEAARLQRDKRGVEVDQGLFLSHVLADPACGLHLCHAMLLPRGESAEKLAELDKRGELDLGGASVHREGPASVVTMKNPRFLNAEDESTLGPLETAIDLALLDPKSEICVLRGGPVSHPKHSGRRLFGAGINLTHLYHGKIRYLWFILRDMGLVNKLYRGVAFADVQPEVGGREKPWIAAVEGFAIGGHCQILVAVDHTIAAADAYMTLPARKEGIIPGAANLRMPRFVGDRIARQAVMNDLRLDCASPEGRMICSEIVPAGAMDTAIRNTVERLTGSGVVSAAGNRRAFRIAQEPLDTFRRYMSVYAREQAYCHFSPQLIANLERNWNAAQRRA